MENNDLNAAQLATLKISFGGNPFIPLTATNNLAPKNFF